MHRVIADWRSARYVFGIFRCVANCQIDVDWTVVITRCGRICCQSRKITVSQVFAGQKVGVKEVDEHIWLVTFMHYVAPL